LHGAPASHIAYGRMLFLEGLQPASDDGTDPPGLAAQVEI
jgi:hypothetical protein